MLTYRSRRNITRKVGWATLLASCGLATVTGLGYVAHADPSPALVRMAVYLPVIRYGLPPCNDVEDNDMPGQARPMVPLSQECAGSFEDDPVSEDDYYSVTLSEGQTLTAKLSDIPTGADYDLILYPFDSSTEVATSNQHGNLDEQISYTVPSGRAGTYLIRLNIYVKSETGTNSYVLRADIQ